MKPAARLALGGALLAGAAGCGAGAAGTLPAQARCESITGGAPTMSAAGEASASENRGLAADGDLTTYARLGPVSDEAVVLRATAQAGIVFPSGRRAGAWILASNMAPGAALGAVAINTYLQGRPMERSSQAGSLTRLLSMGRADGSYVFLTTKTAFDSVELVLAGGSARARPGSLLIYEICSDGGLR